MTSRTLPGTVFPRHVAGQTPLLPARVRVRVHPTLRHHHPPLPPWVHHTGTLDQPCSAPCATVRPEAAVRLGRK